MVTWKQLLERKLEELNDPLVATTLTDEEANTPFDSGYGSSEGCSFTAWGEKYVYFPIVYDGSEWIGHAPRNPCEEKMPHDGGQ